MSDVELAREKKEKRKKEKKEKKLKKEQDEKLSLENNEVTAVPDDAFTEKKVKKSKKDKKKDKTKGLEEETSKTMEIAENIVNDNEDPTVNEKKKDKKKKKRKSEEIETTESIPSAKKLKSKEFSKSKTSSSDYIEHEDVTKMKEEMISAFRIEASIEVFPKSDSDLFKPITAFPQLYPSLGDHCPEVQQYITKMKFKQPSPIQAQCWPPLLSGRDVIGIAATGSGKTLAFLIPALLQLSKYPDSGSGKGGYKAPCPRMLIIAPTRELAMQSHQVAEDMNSVKSVCIYGGVPKQHQKMALKDAKIVVATPGRLLDLLDEGALSLSQIQYLVLDEADRMLDEGFEPAIRRIISACPAPKPIESTSTSSTYRQTVMFSATWPEEIRALAEKYLRKDVVRVTVGSAELSANHRVTQIVECVQAHEKEKKLLGLLEKYHKSRTNRCLLFVLYKKEAANLQWVLEKKGFNVTAIHGDKSQQDRTNALEEFKSGRVPLLIATDVAARGLDIPQVEYVINYSFPLTVEDYVHRIGRTGRGGATGISHTFFTDFDKSLAGALVAVLQEAGQEVPQSIYQYPLITKKKQSKMYGDFGPKAELAGQKAKKITFD